MSCEFGPTQIDCFDRLYSAPRGYWTLKFLHALDTDHGLLAHTAKSGQGSPQNFKGEHLKLGLKFHA